jgi:hypothetical protein
MVIKVAQGNQVADCREKTALPFYDEGKISKRLPLCR